VTTYGSLIVDDPALIGVYVFARTARPPIAQMMPALTAASAGKQNTTINYLSSSKPASMVLIAALAKAQRKTAAGPHRYLNLRRSEKFGTRSSQLGFCAGRGAMG
jgi:hypothetical protein